jgi:hypothetical protein
MIRDKYIGVHLRKLEDAAPPATENKGRASYVFERPLPPDTLLRVTEDFSPIYEMAFRPGITAQQGRATMRTIERVHYAKSCEMASWSAAMKRAEAEKYKAIRRIEEDMEVDQLRAQLKVIRSRLDEKSKEIDDNSHFQHQVSALRSALEKDRGEQHLLYETPDRHRDVASTSARSGKKQQLYNALHYSALYDDGAISGNGDGANEPCPCCGAEVTSPGHVHVGDGGHSAHPVPWRPHEPHFPDVPRNVAPEEVITDSSGRGRDLPAVRMSLSQGGRTPERSSRKQPFGASKKGLGGGNVVVEL